MPNPTNSSIASSPAATGPAGPVFELCVGAHYLQAMLMGAEPRGLPGSRIRAVEFQRRADDHPLDDVIVHAEDAAGAAATLGVQVKRSVTFAPTDPVFRDVVLQMGQTMRRDDFTSTRYEMAVAIERTSAYIEHDYQEVLRWARTHSSAADFVTHIERRGQGGARMQTFVQTVRDHLAAGGFGHDDTTVWTLLRRFQILHFDFGHPGSQSEAWARDRSALLLAAADVPRAGELWAALAEAAGLAASTAGDWTAETLKAHLASRTSFQWAGDRRLANARRAISEASRQTLADIRDRIGAVSIDRSSHLANVHAALAGHRYVEIRGDAGVGKSGLLKFLAEQIAIESGVITLSPERTTSGGWLALRTALQCNCDAREFLSDLACDGGGFLFVDGIDQVVDPAKQATIKDLMRAAVDVTGFRVVVTARRASGEELASWLPVDAIAQLNPAAPITLGELSNEEVAVLAAADARLAALLAPSHVAKDVVRNLFRLSRLVARSGELDTLATEVSMARQWWDSADGPPGADVRARARVLHAMAEAVLSASHLYRGNTADPAAVAALVSRGTVRELSTDIFVFGHDVLRDWAVACLLYDEPARLDALSWQSPATPLLVRGFELCARMMLELHDDGVPWQRLFARACAANVHPSWRRTALLALVRSERAAVLMDHVTTLLIDGSGELLSELIRTTVAADSESAEAAFRRAGLEVQLPPDILMPVGQSWPRLLIWLMRQREHLPPAILPDVVDLASRWLMATFGRDDIAPTLVNWLHDCLVAWTDPYRPLDADFGGETPDFGIERHAERDLIRYVRNTFLSYCQQTPELADRYLRSFLGRRPAGNEERDLLKHYGATASVAPAALRELTLYTLTATDPDDDDHRYGSGRHHDRNAFNITEPEFHPPSPAQGPFYALLQGSRTEGLALVRGVVNHAISFHTNGRDPADDVIVIPFATGARRFPWLRSYDWSRANNSSNIAASALMALELWAHGRAEAGESIATILADILGGDNPPAAHLLVAVDLVLSHWDASAADSLPFMASAELLLLDQERQALDAMSASGFAEQMMTRVLGDLPEIPEPAGVARLSTLKAKPSRRASLQEYLYHFALNAPEGERLLLQTHLRREGERLGPPDPMQDTLRDVRFTAFHALNLLEPSNYHPVTRTLPGGEIVHGFQYRSPPEELQLIERHERRSGAEMVELNLRLAMGKALAEPATLTEQRLGEGVAWAQRDASPAGTSEEEWVSRSRVTAAALLLRDGSAELKAQHRGWAEALILSTLSTPENPVSRFHSGLDYNLKGIAHVGLLAMGRDAPSAITMRAILDAASQNGVSLAQAIALDPGAVARIHAGLPKAVLRIGLAGQIRPNRRYGDTDEGVAARHAARGTKLNELIDGELRWLAGDGMEPSWQAFPDPEVSARRRGIRLPGATLAEDEETPPPEPDDEVDQGAAAQWLNLAGDLVGRANVGDLRAIVDQYGDWTAKANGAGTVEDGDRLQHSPREWTSAYLRLAVAVLTDMAPTQIDQLVLDRLKTYPDEPFFDAVDALLPAADGAHFNDGPLPLTTLLHVRTTLIDRLSRSSDWRWHIREDRTGVTFHLGPALAALFIHAFQPGRQPNCLLLPGGAERMDALMEQLCALTVAGAKSLYVATLFLGIIEVKVLPRHRPYVVRAAAAWLAAHPNSTTFWVDYGIGGRLCRWLATALSENPTEFAADLATRQELDRILNALIGVGVAPATSIVAAVQRLSQP